MAVEPRMEKFEEFWKIFPKKIEKALARAKWEKITNGGLDAMNKDRDSGKFVGVGVLQATPEEIIQGAWRYRASQIDGKKCRTDDLKHTVLKDGGKYTCSPVTWLNRGRWEDE